MRRSWTRAKNRGAIRILVSCRSPLAVTADKAYVSEQVRQQIKDEGVLPVIPNRSNTARKLNIRSASTAAAPPSRITSVASRISQTRYDIARNFLVATTVVGVLLPDPAVSPDPNLSLLAFHSLMQSAIK